MQNVDVFISYEHTSKSIADNVCTTLESRGIRCWYAPRDVYGDYATSIVDAIQSCKIFVIILSKDASESPHVLNEVEIAYQRIITGDISIIPLKVDADTLSRAMEYYVKRLHWIDATSDTLQRAIDTLYDHVASILNVNAAAAESERQRATGGRTDVRYYIDSDTAEAERLRREDALLAVYEEPIIDKLLRGKKDLVALDVNVLNPACTIARFKRPEISSIIGLTYDAAVAEKGNKSAMGLPVKFCKVDFEKPEFESQLGAALETVGEKKVDFVCLSMAMMDFQKPFKVLKIIKKFLRDGAVMFIRDIDDGAVFAYPDDGDLFKKFAQYYVYNRFSGYRYSGRQAYSVAKRLGAKEVVLEQYGLNTSVMTREQKEELFYSWFSFIPNDFGRMLREDPSNEHAKEVLDFCDEYYDELEERFYSDDVLFNSGYVMYSVKF